MEVKIATTGPARARLARILREDLGLGYARAGVFLPGPSGRPRLLASAGIREAELEIPRRLRLALSSAGSMAEPRTVAFPPEGAEPAGEALVVPLVARGALVLYRPGPSWTVEEVSLASRAAHLVLRELGSRAVFG
jgi:hypothetical protein